MAAASGYRLERVQMQTQLVMADATSSPPPVPSGRQVMDSTVAHAQNMTALKNDAPARPAVPARRPEPWRQVQRLSGELR